MKKKILLTAFDFPPQWGGVATYSWEIAHSLHQLGHEVVVVTKKRSAIPQTDFQVMPLQLAKSGLVSFPLLAFQLIPIIRKFKPDHIICTLWLPGGLATYLAGKILRKDLPYSIAVHGMEIVESNETLLKRFRGKITILKQKCFSHASNCFCVSQFTKDLLLKTVNIDSKKVHVVNNGVNAKNFFRVANNPHKKFPTLLTACRLMRNKGIDQVIKTLPRLVKEFPDLKYYILGEGPDKERLLKLAQLNEVTQYVEFKGKVDHDTLVSHYQDADLFLMISRREQQYVEGFGLVFLEAALCGTPSLGGDSGGIPDAIQDGETGWLVDPYDSQKIEDKLFKILFDRDALSRAGDRAYELTLANKSWQKATEQILSSIDT